MLVCYKMLMLKAWSKTISPNQIARLFDKQYLQNNKLVIILKSPEPTRLHYSLTSNIV